MPFQNQYTIGGTCRFEGKGLHSGQNSVMTIEPAPENTGIVFIRTDISPDASVKAVAGNVSGTTRSTTISCGEVSVGMVEHLMSAIAGMGIDNIVIKVDGPEVPVLDGSSLPFVRAFREAGLMKQETPAPVFTLRQEIEVRDEESGSFIRITPSDRPSIDVTVDFGSRFIGVQRLHWDSGTDYSSEIAPCRTFVFFNEIEFLAGRGLIKGGDIDNAIVIVEQTVADDQVNSLCEKLGREPVIVTSEGYLSNVALQFPDECGRHKLLDLMGDLRLAGARMNVRVTAFKPGHSINTAAARLLADKLVKLQ